MSHPVFPGKIILATDGHPHVLNAAEKVAQMAKATHSDVFIVHVAEVFYHHLAPSTGEVTSFVADTDRMIEGEENEIGREILAKTKKIFEDASVTVSTKLISLSAPNQSVAKALIDEANNNADLLVVGATGHSGLTEWLLGSVAEKVVRHASCPVLVMR